MIGLFIGVAFALSQQPWVVENTQGEALYDQGKITEAISKLEQARRDAAAVQASDLQSSTIFDTLGACYEKAGRLQEARDAFDRSLQIRKNQLKSPDEAIAISLTNEASLSWAMVKPDEAIAFAREAKAMWEALGQTSRREYLVALNNLITAELLRGDLKNVAPVVAKARTLYMRNLLPTDPMLPGSLSVLAAAYKAMGSYGEAAEVAQQAVKLAQEQKAPPQVMSKLEGGLGDIRSMEGRLADAERLLTASVALPAGDSVADVVNAASTYRSLGGVKRLLGKYEQAEAADRHALQMLGNMHGQADLVRGEVLNEFGVVSASQKKWKEAESYLNRAIETLEATFGPGHPNISPIYSDLASFYVQRHRYDKAEGIYKRVLAQETAAFPAEHPAIARDLNNLGSLEFRRGRLGQAEELFAKSKEMMEHTLGAAHEDTALVEANLANTLFKRKRYSEARDHYVRALKTLDRCWGEDDPRLMDILNSFASLSRRQAEPAIAERLETRMERIRVKQAIARERQTADTKS